MRKEVLLAILVGASLGLLITFAVYQSQRNVSDAQKDQVQDVISSQTTDEQETSGQLAITSPEDNLIIDSQRLMVSGTTQANNSVVIALNDLEIITNADASGNFSKEIRLEQGANVLSIYSISQDGLLTRVDRTVIVDEEFLNEDFSEQETEDAAEQKSDEEQAETDKQN